ncbi:MAG: mechanosensitive ion channel family protein [Candidatus Koribacter versatilis]|uniref:Mechanosensitive ion channel family protein n=1 Tax=Candidatus Korobacter versatilis TaxID=658062 RepID=A0A932A9L9_9BACT|nr:mechanosensitive ion channel family protein [Candidatus Koribacter versatilis]
MLRLNILAAAFLGALPAEWQDWRADASSWARHNLVRLLGVVLLALLLIELLKAATRRLGRFSHSQQLPHGLRAQQLRTLATVIDSVGIAVIIFLALMQALPMFGIDMKPLLASAGIAGLAIGFGAQTLVKDVLNGFFILVENQYDIGDTVRLGPVKGTVEEMTLRRTVLRDADGSVHIVPNSEIKIVTNMTRDWTQVSLHVPVAYSEPSEKVIRVLREAAEELRNDAEFAPDIVSEPEVPGIERVGAGEVDYLLLVKTQPGAQYRVSRALRRKVKECFERNQIQVPGPTKIYVAASDRPGQEEIKQ